MLSGEQNKSALPWRVMQSVQWLQGWWPKGRVREWRCGAVAGADVVWLVPSAPPSVLLQMTPDGF